MSGNDLDLPPKRAVSTHLVLGIAGVVLALILGAGLLFFNRARTRSWHTGQNETNQSGSAVQALSVAPVTPATVVPRVERAAPTTHTRASESGSVTSKATDRGARQLVEELAAISDSRDPITKEQAERFKENLAELVRQGTAAIPAIREFLAKNLDAYYVDYQGGDQLGFATLRAALFDALKQIGGPEAQTAMVEALNTTSLPFEILELAKNLEQEAPGLYREQILKATRESLDMAEANLIGSNIEVGPLYRVLENYGGGTAGENVAHTDPSRFQAALALANLPEGQGLPDLIQMAADTTVGASGQMVATEMIAQLAGQNAQAVDALMQMATNGQIRNAVWQRLAPMLAGGEYQPSGPEDAPNAPQSPALADGSSYSLVNRLTTPDQINQRIALIDRFLGVVAADSSAAAALRHERGLLAAKLQ
jgi:hypothetical protein